MRLALAYGTCAPDAVKPLLDGGVLRIFSVARPRTPDEPVSRSALLATFRFASPAFAERDDALSGAVFVENPVNAEGVGTPGFARAYAADGTTPVTDFAVGPAGGEIMLSAVSTTPGYPVALRKLTLAYDPA
jgi:hypothetical protein